MKLGKLLGKGKFGEVYEGSFTDTRDNTHYNDVAIKVLHVSGDGSAAALEQARKEVAIVQKVLKGSVLKETSSIARVLAHVEQDDTLFIVMEKCDSDGIQFEKLISKRKSENKYNEVLGLLKKNLIHLCEGLAQVHKQCVVHRDIKPANVLYKEDTELLKLSDFGLSCYYRLCKGIAGTVNYMEPVCVLLHKLKTAVDQERCSINQFSDVFSLGMTFYYFLTGNSLLPQAFPQSHTEYLEALKVVDTALTDAGKRSEEWNVFTTCLKHMISLYPMKRPTPLQCIKYLETGDTQNLVGRDADVERELYKHKTSNCKN